MKKSIIRLSLRMAILLVAAILAPLVLVPTGAYAEESSSDIETHIFSSEEIQAANIRDQAEADEAMTKHLRGNAMNGVLTDAAVVQGAELSVPGANEELAYIVWDAPLTIESVAIQDYDGTAEGNGAAAALGVESVEPEESDVDPFAGTGFGYEPPSTVNNLTVGGSHCYTVWWTSGYGFDDNSDHKLNPCYYKYYYWDDPFGQPWFYYRDVEFTRAAPTTPNNSNFTIDFTIRSRPWEGDPSILTDYTPRSSILDCNDSGELSLGYDSTSIAFNLTDCSEVFPLTDWGTNRFGLSFIGEYEGRYIRLRAAAMYESVGMDIPQMADYSWVEVKACVYPYCETPEFAEIDEGW